MIRFVTDTVSYNDYLFSGDEAYRHTAIYSTICTKGTKGVVMDKCSSVLLSLLVVYYYGRLVFTYNYNANNCKRCSSSRCIVYKPDNSTESIMIFGKNKMIVL